MEQSLNANRTPPEKQAGVTAANTVKYLEALERRRGKRFKKIFKSITVDNGGWIEKEENLSQSGNAEVSGNAELFSNTEIMSARERGGSNAE